MSNQTMVRATHRDADVAIPEQHLRSAAIIGLLGIALIHFLDVVGKFTETPYITALYLALIGACFVASGLIIGRTPRRGWLLAAAASGATFVAFVLSRTTGLPAAMGDIGNWSEPLGLASLFVEGSVVLMSVVALKSRGGRTR